MSVLDKLTEGIVNRDVSKEGAALRNKWEKTGLLEGLGTERTKDSISRLLENQAKELLRESTSMAAGDVEGFAAVAFPIVRRVFGGLIANELVSVQPMSLPSGLIFFLDFVVSTDGGLTNHHLGYEASDSLFGGGVVASQLTGGVDLTGDSAEDGPYNLNNGYSSPTGSVDAAITVLASGTFGGTGSLAELDGVDGSQHTFDKLCQFDPDFTSGTTNVAIGRIAVSDLTDFDISDGGNLIGVTINTAASGTVGGGRQVRRLNQFSGSGNGHVLVFVASVDGSADATDLGAALAQGGSISVSYPRADTFAASNAIGSVKGGSPWQLEGEENIKEIDIKVDSVAVTAVTKKLKAKWTPELGQDLNAYHNLDAEVELTSILSEQIALEIDREILSDLINGSKAGTLYWSRSPGMFLNRETGKEVGAGASAPDFTGTVSEWYETLIETVNEVSARIHRKTLRGGANFVVCGPELANVLEFTSGFRANITADNDKGDLGAVRTGQLSKKFDVWVDPYFPRNVMLVGRRGNSFLESGYVYAPYVPLQVTPTIFGPEDFVPRKGVMTRYAKKMVRPDMYGLVLVRGLIGEGGSAS